MADKTTVNLTTEQSEKLALAGFSIQDLITLIITKGPAAWALIQQLITLFKGQPTQAKALACPAPADGCCDHKACCQACLASALQTAYLCAEHCAQCTDEE